MNNTCPALRANCMAARCCFCSYCQRCPSLLPPQGPNFFFFSFLIELVKLNTQASLVCNLSSFNFYHLIFIFHHLNYFNFSNSLFDILTQTQFSTSKVVVGFHQKKNQKICQNLPLDFTPKKKKKIPCRLFHFLICSTFFPLNLIILERKL